MVKKLKLNSGIETYDIDNGTEKGAKLKVNFSDTNLYSRFLEMEKSLSDIEKEFEVETSEFKGEIDETGFSNQTQSRNVIKIMRDFDVKIKNKLSDVFGSDNDFDNIFAGVNVMSLDGKGNSIISNFLSMITPIIEQSLDNVRKADSDTVKKLVGNREQRRARNAK